MILGKLILLKREPELFIVLLFVIMVFLILGIRGKKIPLIISIVLSILFITILWLDCLRWHSLGTISLEYTYTSSKVAYRTDDNAKTIPENYTWYPIDSIYEKNNKLTRKIMSEFRKDGNDFDFANKTYLISYGFTLLDLYKLTDDPTCIAIHGYDCPVNGIMIYSIPYKIFIMEDDDRTSPSFYIFI